MTIRARASHAEAMSDVDDPHARLRVAASYAAVVAAGVYGAIRLIRTDNSLLIAAGWLLIVLIIACIVTALVRLLRSSRAKEPSG